jgi:hypothetical protein
MKRSEQGGIAVEASIITPVFLALLLFLITLIRIVMTDMMLQHAVNETTKQMASYFYAVDLLVPSQSDTPTERTGRQNHQFSREKVREVENWLREHEAFLPQEISVLLQLKDGIEKRVNETYQHVLTAVFKPLLIRHIDEKVLDQRKLYVTGIAFPNVKEKRNPYIGLEVRYDMTLPVPFFSRTVSLQKQVFERVWVGDAYLDEGIQLIGEDERNGRLSIHSISSPVQRGRSVKILAYGPPNATASIRFYYHSGFIKDISCRSDSSGFFSCETRIGGNSKEGQYVAVMNVGELEDQAPFTVLSKANYDRLR